MLDKDVLRVLMTRAPVKGTMVRLNQHDLAACRAIAVDRVRNNRAAGCVSGNRHGSRTDEECMTQGMFGEYAFAKLFECSMSDMWDTEPRTVLTDTFDATWHSFTVDVKTTMHYGESDTPPLRVTAYKRVNPPDLYAQMSIDSMVDLHEETCVIVRFGGLLASRGVFKPKHMRLMYGTCLYEMPASLLLNMRDIPIEDLCFWRGRSPRLFDPNPPKLVLYEE